MPSGMLAEAESHWKMVVPELLKCRTLAKKHLGTLAAMCNWWGYYVRAHAQWQEHQLSGKAFDGYAAEHPFRLMCDASDRYVKLASSFGLTPADATRVEAVPAKKKAPEREPGPVMRIAN